MDRGQHAQLRQMCRIFGIPEAATSPDPALALNVMLRMYLVPTIRLKAERNRALNEIRGNLAGHFDDYSPFVLRTAEIAAQMQELPAWWANLNRPTDDLIQTYRSLGYVITGLKIAGIGISMEALAGTAMTEAVKTGSVRQGATKAAQKAVGLGGFAEESAKRLGRLGRFAGLRTGPGKVVAVGGSLIYASAGQQQKEIREILMHRFQQGKLTDDQYRRAFGGSDDPSILKKYWE